MAKSSRQPIENKRINPEPTLKLELGFCSEGLDNKKHVHHKGIIRIKQNPKHDLNPKRKTTKEFYELEEIPNLLKGLLREHGISIVLKNENQKWEILNE